MFLMEIVFRIHKLLANYMYYRKAYNYLGNINSMVKNVSV